MSHSEYKDLGKLGMLKVSCCESTLTELSFHDDDEKSKASLTQVDSKITITMDMGCHGSEFEAARVTGICAQLRGHLGVLTEGCCEIRAAVYKQKKL